MRISWDDKTMRRLESIGEEAGAVIGDIKADEFVRRLKAIDSQWKGTSVRQGRGKFKYYKIEVRHSSRTGSSAGYWQDYKLSLTRHRTHGGDVITAVEFIPSSGKIRVTKSQNNTGAFFSDMQEVIDEAEVVLLALTQWDK